MQTSAVLFVLFVLIYCLVQTWRDVRRRHWQYAIWGGAVVLLAGWVLEGMTRAPAY